MSLVSHENTAFGGEEFGVVELTNAVNRIPYKEELLSTLFDWNVETSHTDVVRINSQEGSIRVVPSTPRDGVAPLRHGDKRKGRFVEIPGYAERGVIMNREVRGVSAGLDGDTAMEKVENLRNQRLKAINADLDVTVEHQRAKALGGQIDDVDGVELANIYDVMGVDQIGFDLVTDGSETIVAQLEEAKEIGEIALGGDAGSVTHWSLIAAKNVSSKLLKNEEYREALTISNTNAMAQILSKDDGRKGVRICSDVDIVHYRRGFLMPNEAYLVPHFDGCAQTILGPCDIEELLGEILPRYAVREMLKGRKGMEIEVWTFILNYFLRPEAILRLNVDGLNPAE